jgi:hypothetical protein
VTRELSIRLRIAAAFEDDPARSFGSRYVEIMLERWCELNRASKRISTLMVILGAGFVLLAGAKTAEFNLGPLKLTNVASILTIAPVIVSFLLHEFVVLVSAAARYREVAYEATANLYPTIEDNDLQRMLAPPTASLWGREQWRQLREKPCSRVARLAEQLDVGVVLALTFGTIGFLVYAFATLFRDPHTSGPLVGVAVVVAGFNLIRSTGVMLDE